MSMSRWMCLLAWAALLAGAPAMADSKPSWKKVAELSVAKKDDGKEVAVAAKISSVRITCTEGSVIINTVVVRQGGGKTPHTVGKRLASGESLTLSVGEKIQVDGLRIGDEGSGKYKVETKP